MNIKTLKMISTDQSEDIKRLDNSLGIYADQILECDRVIKDAKVHKDLCMEKLKEAMGNHVAAKVSDYFLDWGFISYKAQPEKITPAKEARTLRKSNIKIKKIWWQKVWFFDAMCLRPQQYIFTKLAIVVIYLYI